MEGFIMVGEDSKTKEDLTNEYQLDISNKIIVVLAIEMPFWIPIESGEYSLKKNRKVKIRNDLWYVSISNLVDGPIDQASDYIVNEVQVDDKAFLERFTGKTAQYYHKKKMKTTFTRSFSYCPVEGRVTAQPLSKEWQHQIDQVAFGWLQRQSVLGQFLNDINLFIDHYCALIIPKNHSREVRRVNFYETMVKVVLNVGTKDFRYRYITKITPDAKMTDVPYPSFRVTSPEILGLFRNTIQNLGEPAFHQLQWVNTLNHHREKRFQEALVSAAVTLEALVHQYCSAQNLSYTKQTENIGLAGWIRKLSPAGLEEQCEDVAKLWKLRIDFIHKQKLLSEKDIEAIKKGIKSLDQVRTYLLKTGDPDVLFLENQFSSFLEPFQQGQTASASIGKLVALEFGWRREKDHYQIVIVPPDKSSLRDRIRRWLRRKVA